MTLFWIGAFALSLIAAIAIFWPWIFKTQRTEHDRERLNVMLVKERVTELQRDLEEGILTAEQKAQAEEELKLSLLNEVEQNSTPPSQGLLKSKGSKMLSVGALCCVLLSGWAYWKSNELADLQDWQRAKGRLGELGERVVMKNDESLTSKDLQDFLLALRTRLAEKPDDAVGWLLMGRIFASLQSVDYAIEAFEKSLAIEPERVGTLVSFGQTLLLTDQENNIKRAKQLLLKAVSINPKETDALGLLAIAATQLGEKDLAKTAWTELGKVLEEDDPLQQVVKNKIAELDAVETELKVAISIEPALTSALPEQGYLIVFARQANSDMKMPVAVVKQPLTQLPLVITLSDKNAMIPALNLSSLELADVVVRISKDDKVEAQTGDLEGEVTVPITRSQLNEITIEINKELP
ncbi:c-type cytochrome biogenesis protein CcmI [Alteromonas sp. a30]|uniref:c-type cytochrome biogenesis protein CcmI n=1 Tax=Alteromonas sp. a30 TaxID=2730917 RepID=UPI00227F2526|nr:c-type cytochrome biogenesis protein CcmI [Alteromonas sp. a30]MCY7294397.1 c-type cytochrome biogenesis protein CcmI [Alteromonas sp. a30]